ncbi:hypothetical protein EC973_003011 [Apophysomyces ossiformis]|uniref:F-box domain-containing protein n=1 Tax=Apophysomyces ossiformis TaxID=679940 RepID=A0A8H7EV09_9FUNG|nr:hypothetical protein EC973_003011 [Apophysomyces ossiformis]
MPRHSLLSAEVKNLSLPTCNEALPPEILQDIADRLPRRTWPLLVTVCRSWYDALIPLLYGSVEIHSDKQFASFLNTLITMTTTRSNRSVVQYVHELRIEHVMYENNLPLPAQLLSNTLPDASTTTANNNKGYLKWLPFLPGLDYLERVVVKHRFLIPSSLPISYFRHRLRALSVTIMRKEEWYQAMTELEALEELDIYFQPYKGTEARDEIISVADLEMLHNTLSRLRCLRLDTLWSFRIEELQDIVPCHTVRELSLKKKSVYLWYPYFSRKYTQLETLSLSPPEYELFHTQKDAKSLAASCQHLKKLNMAGFEDYRLFLDHLASIRAPMTYLVCHYGEASWFGQKTQAFSRTLSQVNIWVKQKRDIHEILEPLKLCPVLVDLVIWFYQTPVEVDVILNALEGLEHLFLRAPQIDTRQNTVLLTEGQPWQQQHRKLRRLKIHAKEIDNQVYLYLSAYCPRLYSLGCWYDVPVRQEHTIYYPLAGLKCLDIHSEKDCVYKLTRLNDTGCTADGDTVSQQSLRDTRWYSYDSKKRLVRLKSTQLQEVLGNLGSVRTGGLRSSLFTVLCHYVDSVKLNQQEVI